MEKSFSCACKYNTIPPRDVIFNNNLCIYRVLRKKDGSQLERIVKLFIRLICELPNAVAEDNLSTPRPRNPGIPDSIKVP